MANVMAAPFLYFIPEIINLFICFIDGRFRIILNDWKFVCGKFCLDK